MPYYVIVFMPYYLLDTVTVQPILQQLTPERAEEAKGPLKIRMQLNEKGTQSETFFVWQLYQDRP